MATRRAKRPILVRDRVQVLIDALLAATPGPLFTAGTCGLWTAATGTLSWNMVFADLTEAAFGGYAPVSPLTWSSSVLLPNGAGLGRTANALFQADATIVLPGEVILGYYVSNAAVDLYIVEQFDDPVPFSRDGDFLDLQVMFALNSPAELE